MRRHDAAPIEGALSIRFGLLQIQTFWIIASFTMHELTTSASVIEALGGLNAVATLTGSQYSAVHNWKVSDRFPAKTYVAMTAALGERNYTAPSLLWGMVLAGAEPTQ